MSILKTGKGLEKLILHVNVVVAIKYMGKMLLLISSHQRNACQNAMNS